MNSTDQEKGELNQDNPVTGEEINLIRERTFNSSLRQLVEKVSGNRHEPGTGVPKKPRTMTDDDFLQPARPSQLVASLHRLYYSVVNLPSHECSPRFFPIIDLEKEDPSGRQLFNKLFHGSDVSDFALLRYRFRDRSFRPLHASFDMEAMTNFTLHLKDPLMNRIRSGIAEITNDEITSDRFLNKTMGTLIREGENLYLQSFSAFTGAVNDDLTAIQGLDERLRSQALLLLFRAPVMPVFSADQKRLLAVYFYGLYGLDEAADCDSPVLSVSNHIDYFLDIYGRHSDSISLMVKSREPYSQENQAFISALVAELNRHSSSETKILQFLHSTICILTREAHEDSLRRLISDMQDSSGLICSVTRFSIPEIRRNGDLIRRYFT